MDEGQSSREPVDIGSGIMIAINGDEETSCSAIKVRFPNEVEKVTVFIQPYTIVMVYQVNGGEKHQTFVGGNTKTSVACISSKEGHITSVMEGSKLEFNPKTTMHTVQEIGDKLVLLLRYGTDGITWFENVSPPLVVGA